MNMNIFGFDITGLVTVLKVIGFIVSLGFGVGLVIVLLRDRELSEETQKKYQDHFHVHPEQEDPQNQRWNDVIAHFQSHSEPQWRIAIINADIMLEDMVTRLGYQGTTFGEKLKSIPYTVSWLQDAWNVHLLRNRLVHEGTQYLTEREAYQAFRTYERIFYETGYLS